MRSTADRASRMENTTRAEALLARVLDDLLNGHRRAHIAVDKNLIDGLTARLLDAGVEMDEFDAVLAEGDPALIGERALV